jgi:ATP-dependent protease ClpP protease subunit
MDNRIGTTINGRWRVVGQVPFPLGTFPTSLDAAATADGQPRLRTVRRPTARLNPNWYRITNKANDPEVTIIDIYDEIGWFGITAAEFVKDLRAVTTPKIELHISSPGGDVFDAVAIYNGLRQHDANVHVIIDSLAASAASFIAMAGDTITATPNAMLMIHDALGLVIGNAADMREMAGLLDKHSDNIASIYAVRAGGDTAGWREKMSEEVWYNAEEALKAGLVDEIQGDEGRPIEDRWDLSIFGRADPTVNEPPPGESTPAPTAAATPELPAPELVVTARREDAPRSPAPSDSSRRRSYLGETATWYLPPSRKEHP